MLTPQEVAEHAFSKATFGGYNMTMVDDFLDILTEDYTTLYEENAVLKRKMKVLADKVEEYRSTDDAMRKALLTVQRQADELVQDAEAKKAALLENAETEAVSRKQQLAQEIAAQEQRLAQAKASAAEYLSALKALVGQQVSQIEALEQIAAPAAQPVEDAVAQAAQEIEDSMQRILAEEQQQSAPEEETAPQEEGAGEEGEALSPDEAPEEPVEEPTRRIDFSHLQFGKDYEIQ